ncbi:META domain-containing protein [Bacteroides ilei]|jgi:heat shock protein HslJ|uniref:META domain-containing protein n=1 Tax=Bacteroides ilei TaxID=1907658 RepID=UPI0009310245|nr:META domain-containing protein [Bacteroides ilei]
MKKIFLGVAAICAGALVTSCGSGKKIAGQVDLSGEWTITSVGGEKIDIAEMPYIGFDVAGKRVYGNSGCNRMSGELDIDTVAYAVKLGNVASTRMMCPYMDTETKVLDALANVAGYKGTEEGAVLTDAEGKDIMSLVRREAVTFSFNDLNGKWNIVAVDGVAVGQTEEVPFLAFDLAAGRVNGNAGCNIINGDFKQEEGKSNSLKFGQMIATMKACPDMETERRILQALDKVRSFGTNPEGALALLDENGVEILTLSKVEE